MKINRLLKFYYIITHVLIRSIIIIEISLIGKQCNNDFSNMKSRLLLEFFEISCPVIKIIIKVWECAIVTYLAL